MNQKILDKLFRLGKLSQDWTVLDTRQCSVFTFQARCSLSALFTHSVNKTLLNQNLIVASVGNLFNDQKVKKCLRSAACCFVDWSRDWWGRYATASVKWTLTIWYQLCWWLGWTWLHLGWSAGWFQTHIETAWNGGLMILQKGDF